MKKILPMPNCSSSMKRQESEETWRQKLDEAYRRYQLSTARSRALLEKAVEGQRHGPDDPLVLARDLESEALAEYSQLLKIVTDLMVDSGKREMKSAGRRAEENG